MDQTLSHYKWYVLALVSMSVFFFNVPRLCLPVLFKEISLDLNLNLVQVGTIWGMDPLGGIFVSLFSGLIIDRFGVKRTITVIAFLIGITGMVRGLSSDFISLLSTVFVFGLVISATPIVMPKVLALWFKNGHLGLANGVMITMSSAGGMVTSMVSATFLSPALGGWRNILFLYGLLPVAGGILWLFTYRRREDFGPQTDKEERVPFRRAFFHIIHMRGVWILGIIMMGAFGTYMGVCGYLPIYLRGIGWDHMAADSALMAMIGSVAAGAIPISLMSDRLGSRKSVLVPTLIIMAIAVCMISAANGAAIWVLIIVSGFVVGGIIPLTFSTIVETKGVGDTFAGTAVGVAGSLAMMGGFLAPPIGNSFTYIQSSLPFVFWALLPVIALISLFFLKESI